MDRRQTGRITRVRSGVLTVRRNTTAGAVDSGNHSRRVDEDMLGAIFSADFGSQLRLALNGKETLFGSIVV
jgi:hypothetical protein